MKKNDPIILIWVESHRPYCSITWGEVEGVRFGRHRHVTCATNRLICSCTGDFAKYSKLLSTVKIFAGRLRQLQTEAEFLSDKSARVIRFPINVKIGSERNGSENEKKSFGTYGTLREKVQNFGNNIEDYQYFKGQPHYCKAKSPKLFCFVCLFDIPGIFWTTLVN